MFQPAPGKIFNFCIALLILTSCRDDRDRCKIMFTGDVMLDRGVKAALEKERSALLPGDLLLELRSCGTVLGNFESASCSGIPPAENQSIVLQSHPPILPLLRQCGITHASLANNHSDDFGKEGLSQTEQNLRRAGIVPVGGPDKVISFDLRDGKMVIVFSSLLGSFAPSNEKELLSKVRKLHREAPGKTIAVVLHWGRELSSRPTERQIRLARRLVDLGAGLVVGHHSHTIQSIEKYKGKFIFYSLGNFIFDRNMPPGNEGALLKMGRPGEREEFRMIPLKTVRNRPEKLSETEMKQLINDLQHHSPGVELIPDGEEILVR